MANAMTSRERLRRCFSQEELDRPGIFVRTGMPPGDTSYDPLRRILQDRTDLKFSWPVDSLISSWPIAVTEEPYSEQYVRIVQRMETPGGELVRIDLCGLHNQPGYTEKHLVSSPEDAETYLSLPLPQIGGNLDSFFKLQIEAGDRGIVVLDLGLNPAGLTAELIGSETLAMMTLTDREVIHTLCERFMKVRLAALEFLLAKDAGPFFCMCGEEYMVPPLHGPCDFQDFNVRYDKPIVDKIHEVGGRIHIHSHGRIKNVLPGFLKIGADILHPFEAPPMGDITAAEAKQMVRGKMCIEGNIQIADMYEKSPENIREQTHRLIRDCFDDHRGLIVCPTASPYIPGEGEKCLPRFEAMIQTVLEYT
jgi:hypothetical protein